MMMKAMTDATAWVAIAAAGAGSQANASFDQGRQRRLADPAQSQGGQRDAELGGRDVAIERLYGAASQPSFAVPGLGHLVEPGPSRSHQREFRRHEERVGQHEHHHRAQAQENGG